MRKALITAVIICSSALLVSCNKAPRTMPQEEPSHDAYVTLAEAADFVGPSLTQLGATEQAAYPPVSVTEPPNPASYGMEIPATIEWNGPIEPLTQQIANATNYKLQVLGRRPSIPVLVSISAKNAPMGDILRDAGYQCGKHAQVIVFPARHIIELRYANI